MVEWGRLLSGCRDHKSRPRVRIPPSPLVHQKLPIGSFFVGVDPRVDPFQYIHLSARSIYYIHRWCPLGNGPEYTYPCPSPLA